MFSTHAMTGKRSWILLVIQIVSNSVIIPIAPVGICMRIDSKLENPNPFVMIPPKAPMPPEGIEHDRKGQQSKQDGRGQRGEAGEAFWNFSFHSLFSAGISALTCTSPPTCTSLGL